jgi:N-formylglutamate deformylase
MVIVEPQLVRIGAPQRTALVLSVPHGGRAVPAEFQAGLTIDPPDLWSDWYTDELYNFGTELAIPTIVAGLSRFVADPNRDATGRLHGSFWSTVVPATDPWDRPLYEHPLDPTELHARIAAAHGPYHRALDLAIERALDHHPRVLLLDLHSFGLPLGADIVVGDRNGASADPATSAAVAAAFAGAGFHVAHDGRFTGGHIVSRHVGDDRVDAIQIELNQRRYLVPIEVDEARPRPTRDAPSWQRTRTALRGALQQLAYP